MPSNRNNPVLDIAREYLAAGYSVVPILTDGTKRPSVQWKRYQEEKPEDADLKHWFWGSSPYGIALVHGAVSGNSEVLDFETEVAYQEWDDLCQKHGLVGIGGRPVIVETPTGGRHFYYRCTEPVEGNQKLARAADGTLKIETRGEGGYTIVPGSPDTVHPSGRPYNLAWGSFDNPPILLPAQRKALLDLARACNQHVEPERVWKPRETAQTATGNGKRVGDDYNERCDLVELLTRHGWSITDQRGDVAQLARPGKNPRDGFSATVGYVAPNTLYVFSTNALPFEGGHAYEPFTAYALLEHSGDFSAAAKALVAEGYGEPLPPPVRSMALSWEDEEAEPTTDLDIVASGKPWTDFGNAERLILRHGTDLRYSPAVGWMVWDGRRWAEDASGERVRRMKLTVRRIAIESSIKLKQASKAATKEERKEFKRISSKLFDWAEKSEEIARVRAALDYAKSEAGVHIEPERLDTDPWLLNCLNGTLDLRNGCLREHRQIDLLTKLGPVLYDPDAPCPLWNAFLKRILPDQAVRFYVQQMAGYSLTGEVSLQNLMFLWGGGQNGKSTFITTLLAMMGEYGRQASSDLLVARRTEAVREDIASLAGSRLVATVEVDEGRTLAEALMKQLTGGDTIRARHLYQKSFEFAPTFKIWLAANHKPQVKAGGKSVWRRIKLIPFTETISEAEKDPELPTKLKTELCGILAWAVRGCLSWQKEGVQEPDAVKAGTEEYRQETDQIGLFITECCDTDEGCQVRPNDLYHAYCRWAEDRRERPRTLAYFGSQMGERGIGKKVVRGNNWYTGIGLKTVDEDPQDGLWTAV